MKRVPKERGVVPVRAALARAGIAGDKDRAGSRTNIEALTWAAYSCSLHKSRWRPFHLDKPRGAQAH